MGYLKSIGTSIIWIYTALLVITFWPGLYPYAEFAEYNITEPKPLSGNLAVNKKLDNPEILFQGQVIGPEAFAFYNGEVYTGLATGEIVKITKDKKLEIVFKIGEYDKEQKFYKGGRPLGLKIDKDGFLYVADLAFGILKIDVKTKKSEVIVDAKIQIDGKRAVVADDLDIASNGDIYWSDVCSDVAWEGSFYGIALSNPAGRLIRYNAKTKQNEVLVRDLAFANGVALAEDESFVLVAETFRSQVIKYHLKGPKAGKQEVLIDGLPGMPDNIFSDGAGGFLVSIPGYMDAEHTIYMKALAPHPYVRRGIARLFALIKAPFEFLHKLYPDYDPSGVLASLNIMFDKFVFTVQSDITGALRMDKDGKIIDVAFCTNGKLPGLSSAQVFGEDLWLGSYKAPHVGKIPLKRAFPSLAKKPIK